MAEHDKEYKVLYSIIQTMVNSYNIEMRKDIIREKAIRNSVEMREDKESLTIMAAQLRTILSSVIKDTATVQELLLTATDPKTLTWGSITLKTLCATKDYLSEYIHACDAAISADPMSDLSDLFEAADNMRDAFEEQYEAFVQVTGIK